MVNNKKIMTYTENYYFRTALDKDNLVSYAIAFCTRYNNGNWQIKYYLGIDQKPALFIRSTKKTPMEIFKEHNLIDNVEVSTFTNGRRDVLIPLQEKKHRVTITEKMYEVSKPFFFMPFIKVAAKSKDEAKEKYLEMVQDILGNNFNKFDFRAFDNDDLDWEVKQIKE